MKILIAEDDLISRNFLNKFLSKYGSCDLASDGLEAVDAFLMSLKEKNPYKLVCIDFMMPKADGIKALKAIRQLEDCCKIPAKDRVKIVMTTAITEKELINKAFDYGCDAYISKPIDTKIFLEMLKKLNLIPQTPHKSIPSSEIMDNHLVRKPTRQRTDGYFKSVIPLDDYHLNVTMETGTIIHFDFRSRLNTARFGKLKDKELFQSVFTDGNYLIFSKEGKTPVKITASEFMDLVLIDRTK